MKIAVVPCFNRPEYLEICIEYIKKANNYDKINYLFCLDYGFDKANIPIIENSGLNFQLLQMTKQSFNLGKQSFNVINGLLSGAIACENDLLYYIEEDIFIGVDFFDNAEKIFKQEKDLFCLIQSRNVNGLVKQGDINQYYVLENTNNYQGIGTCFNSEMILEYLNPHHVRQYYMNPSLYVTNMFNSELNNIYAEQDGLIRRIIEQNKLNIGFTCVPRCFHAGIYGYNRYSKHDTARMSFKEKKQFILDFAFDKEKLKGIVIAENLYIDSEPMDLTINYKGEYEKKD